MLSAHATVAARVGPSELQPSGWDLCAFAQRALRSAMERLAELPESLKLHLLALLAQQQQQDEGPAQMALLQQQQQQDSNTSPAPAAGISASSESTSYLQDLPELPPLSASGLAVVDGFLTPGQLQVRGETVASWKIRISSNLAFVAQQRGASHQPRRPASQNPSVRRIVSLGH